ncbi:hypothetical protein NTE_03135 [Candidatus Nitrososphaera evergladensis SR1]|uniref:Uncharacterized protein n=1 Tax=Candidatus Nitrososphaera evergladensis SR1 TaxID=1459636 RepID=A0A075N110_9ARCH|nr:hypothetical protein [Candidatus Nitrososphaera evergladensis]AIF85169.1 hypothetical protein NTE_03135 [Candidatus Nitrososphaera evergladensis SR1]
MTMMTTSYNKISCRVCGHAFSVAQTCGFCQEPFKWHCRNCGNVDDSTHSHHLADGDSSGNNVVLQTLLVLDNAA